MLTMIEIPSKRSRLDSVTNDTDELPQYSESNHSVSDESRSNCLTELDVGIQAFVNPKISGFNCTLKNRWEDFMVQEISHGMCAQLTCTDAIDFATNEPEHDALSSDTILEPYESQLMDLLNHRCDQIKFEAPDSKETRTAIHKAIRTVHPKLDSRTVKENDRQFIVVNRVDGMLKRSRISKEQAYCRFVLYKEGKDTISAIQLLSRCLHIRAGSFAYAGTKDRRAITTQFVTLKGIDSIRLSALNKKLRGIRLGNFSYVPKPLFLGDLDGNRFTVVLRAVDAPESDIREAVEAWQRDGFINYYGLQRFGHSAKAKSFDTGRFLIQGDWSNAIKTILLPTEADLPCIRRLKEDYLKSGDAKQCADLGPPCMERELLWGVGKHGTTVQALQSLPRNLRQLYVHSYQSLIWNRIATRRICDLSPDSDRHPRTVAGDLYIPSAASLDCEPLVDFSVVPEELDPNKTVQVPRMHDRYALPCPKVATTDDCSYIPVTDVVLPLPGFAVRYPENESGQWYHDLLKEDGLTVDSLRHKVKDFALPGSYRALIVKPQDVSYQIREYTDPNIPLIKSDLEKLSNSTIETQLQPSTVDLVQSEDTESVRGKPERAVVLQFTLPKSSYATIAIRELTKSFVEKR